MDRDRMPAIARIPAAADEGNFGGAVLPCYRELYAS